MATFKQFLLKEYTQEEYADAEENYDPDYNPEDDDGYNDNYETDAMRAVRVKHEALQWLEDYVYEIPRKVMFDYDHKEYLLGTYPYDGGVLYRGLNFSTKELYNKFLESTKNGTELKTTRLTSWSTNLDTAEHFSITRVSDIFSNASLDSSLKMQSSKDYMTGFQGVVLKLHCKPNQGIDISKHKEFNRGEAEVLLDEGTYKIEILRNKIPFKRTITKDTYKDILKSIKTLDITEDKAKFEFILTTFLNLTNLEKDKVWSLLGYSGLYSDIEIPSYNKNRLDYYIIQNNDYDMLAFYDMFLEKHKKIIYKDCLKALKNIGDKIESVIQKTPDIEYEFNGNSDVYLAIKITGFNPIKDLINNRVKKQISKLNSMKTMNNINSLRGKEQTDAIKKYSDDLIRNLKSLSERYSFGYYMNNL